DTNAAQNVFNLVTNKGITIDLLINNAGFGDYGAFVERERERQLQMIQLNVLALVDLTYQFLPGMRERKSGGIINLASIAAFQPLPYLAVYAATKSFVLSFSEALWAENSSYGVKILAVCPGSTETEFFQEAKFPKGFESGNKNSYTSPEEVVKESLKALAENKANIVTGGWKNQIIVNASRFLPRETLVSTIEKQFKM
ncbi:MAG TPA: SDR family NAD(P)-dependent oxidoreductase, partial [Allocoleopsis sp.]